MPLMRATDIEIQMMRHRSLLPSQSPRSLEAITFGSLMDKVQSFIFHIFC